MKFKLSFISQENLYNHVAETISHYGDTLKSIDLDELNKNIVDPVKLIFDKSVYNLSWPEVISNEIHRQRDKHNNNAIGYFHQNIFKYIKNCEVPTEVWDVIYHSPNPINYGGHLCKDIFVEMKNKHNTMNSSASSKTFMRMQNKVYNHDRNNLNAPISACFLVEAIAKKSQNIPWSVTVDKEKICDERIRRVSLDQFYALVTGEEDAFFELCCQLQNIITDIMTHNTVFTIPKDTAFEELVAVKERIKLRKKLSDEELAMILAIYFLGFNDYFGFKKISH